MAGMGWIMAIIIGGIAGLVAEKIMKANMGALANIIVGILGAVLLNAILAFAGVATLGGIIGQGIIAIIGACGLIFVYRIFKGRKAV